MSSFETMVLFVQSISAVLMVVYVRLTYRHFKAFEKTTKSAITVKVHFDFKLNQESEEKKTKVPRLDLEDEKLREWVKVWKPFINNNYEFIEAVDENSQDGFLILEFQNIGNVYTTLIEWNIKLKILLDNRLKEESQNLTGSHVVNLKPTERVAVVLLDTTKLPGIEIEGEYKFYDHDGGPYEAKALKSERQWQNQNLRFKISNAP